MCVCVCVLYKETLSLKSLFRGDLKFMGNHFKCGLSIRLKVKVKVSYIPKFSYTNIKVCVCVCV